MAVPIVKLRAVAQAEIPGGTNRVITIAANTMNVVPPGHAIPIHTSAAAIAEIGQGEHHTGADHTGADLRAAGIARRTCKIQRQFVRGAEGLLESMDANWIHSVAADQHSGVSFATFCLNSGEDK
jgi:hypothetical protein